MAETITCAASGLVFVNTCDTAVTSACRPTVIAHENFPQAHLSASVMMTEATTSRTEFVAENESLFQIASYASEGYRQSRRFAALALAMIGPVDGRWGAGPCL